MFTVIKVAYYLCFGWLIILVAAELGALVLPGSLPFSSFLSTYFFSWFTYFAMGFVLARFIVIALTDISTKLNSQDK